MRVALVGCGFFARHQLEAWLGLPGVRVVAVCDAVLERAQDFAARAGAQAFTDARTMLETVAVDVVDIAAPPAAHRALVELAAEFGRDAICQKPLADSLEDARAMVQTCANAGVRLTVHENFRFQSALRTLHTARGALGRVHYARIAFRCPYDVYANQPYLATTPRFVLMDVGVHLLDLARFYLGEVTDLHAHLTRVNPRINGEDHAVLLLTHANGACSVVEISYASALEVDAFPTTEVWLEGATGSARVTNLYGADARPSTQRLTVCTLETAWVSQRHRN